MVDGPTSCLVAFAVMSEVAKPVARGGHSFEKFHKRAAPQGVAPLVTIQRGGTLSLNNSAYTCLGGPEMVELLFNREARVMGLRTSNKGDKDAYPLRQVGRGNTFAVTARAYCTYYDIPTEVARRYYAAMQGDVLIVDLNADPVYQSTK